MIRLAEAADVPRISQLWAEMVAHHARFDSDTFRAADNGAEVYARFLQDRLRDPQSRLLVVDRQGQVVGYISGAIAEVRAEMFVPLRCGLITDLYAGAGYRRQGSGRALVERLALWFRAQGLSSFELSVSALIPAALGFWRALGGETTLLRMRVAIPGGE